MDSARLAHIGVEVAVVGGVAYYLNNKVSKLEVEVVDLKRQLAHLALHFKNSEQEQSAKLKAVSSELEKVRKGKERASNRDLLRVAALESGSPPASPRKRRGSATSSPPVPRTPPPPPPTARKATAASESDSDNGSENESDGDVAAVLKSRAARA